ncbi:hypothetical protein CU276_07735 [Yersinia kristensenii]|nr:hypothetical protein CU276_07735 [Yersinia kristensenii]
MSPFCLSCYAHTGAKNKDSYPVDFEIQEGGKRENPDELTKVSDSGDKSVWGRFEHCLQRPRRGEAQGWAEY